MAALTEAAVVLPRAADPGGRPAPEMGAKIRRVRTDAASASEGRPRLLLLADDPRFDPASGEGYASLLNDRLCEDFDVYHLAGRLAGSADALAALPEVCRVLQQGVVLVSLARGDAAAGLPPAAHATNMRSLLGSLRQTGLQVFCFDALPLSSAAADAARHNAAIDEYRRIDRQLAAGLGCTVLAGPAIEPQQAQLFSTDGRWLAKEGQRLLFRSVRQGLKRALPELLRRETPLPKRGERLVTHAAAIEHTAPGPEAVRLLRETSTYGERRIARTANIVNDFFTLDAFTGKRVLELGPGQFAFSLLARYLGAAVTCVDRNEPFITVGQKLGFEMLALDYDELELSHLRGPDSSLRPVDGLWLKGSFNPCHGGAGAWIDRFVEKLTSFLAPDGWGWVAPNVSAKSLRGGERQRVQLERMELQRSAFARHGWTATRVLDADRDRYAFPASSYPLAPYIYTRNLVAPPSSP